MTEKTVKKVLVFIVAAAVLFAGSSAGLSVAGAVNLPDTEMEGQGEIRADAEPVAGGAATGSAISPDGGLASSDIEALKDTRAMDLFLTVNQKDVYFPEVMVYVLGSKDSLETGMGNDKFWNIEENGHTVSQLAADDIRRELIQLKVIVQAAENAGISLTDDEENELMETARAQLQNVDPEIKARYYIDENVLYKVYHDNFLAYKFYGTYTDAAAYELEAKRRFTADFKQWYEAAEITTYETKWKSLDVGLANPE